MSDFEAQNFGRYLAAKKAIDDRSLNRQVWDCLARALETRPSAPLRVLEVGCGIGTMLERLLAHGLLRRAHYRGIDREGELIREAAPRLARLAASRGATFTESAGTLKYQSAAREVTVALEVIDLVDFLAREEGSKAWDLLLAHAFLDLVPLPATLPRLLALLAPGGLFYFTLNFDGATIFDPPIDLELDRQIETLYHRTMDERPGRDAPPGGSLTGRRLFGQLRAAGATILAAGSSDWVVFPGPAGYSPDEAYFLHFIVETVHRALKGHPRLDAARFRSWVKARQAQIEAGQLTYIAHQLDFFGYI